MATAPPPNPAKIAALSSNPHFVKAQRDQGEMQTALSKVLSRLAEVSILLQQSSADARPPGVDDALQFAQTGMVMRRSGQVDALAEEQATLRQHEDSLRRAIDASSQAMQRIVGEASAAVSRDMAPRHKAIAARYLAKLVELDALVMEEVRLASEIEAAGYTPAFREWLHWPLIGRLDDNTSQIHMRVKELKPYAA
ncbi:MAG: hypothetical protein IPG93_10895 [Burkholderiales bacterium]|nr:hypothetical protein [Burkholderiales bacterium]